MKELDLYSRVEEHLGIEEETKALHTAFLEIIGELKSKTLLDIGCGQGFFLEKLEDMNIESLGIDLSPNQIKICTNKNLNAKCIDLCKVTKKFECATAIFDVVNFVTKKNIRNFFECAFRVLKKDGYFLFDVNTLYGFEDVAQGSMNINLKDDFIAVDAIYENKSLNTNITLFTKKGELYEKESQNIKQDYHTKEFLEKELKKCGFDVESVLSFKLYDVEEFDKQIFICKK